MNAKVVKDGTYFKFSDGEYCVYNFLGGGSEIIDEIMKLDKYTVTRISGRYAA